MHQIKTHLMTPLDIRCRNTCVSVKFVFFLTKCSIHVNYPNLNSFFFTFYWINDIVFIRSISLFKIVFDYIS